MSSESKLDGFAFGGVGLFLAGIGMAMIVFQLATEEFVFTEGGEIGGADQGPVGLEFAFVFFSFGLVFFFIGLGMNATSSKKRTVYNHLAGGTGLSAALGVIVMVISIGLLVPHLFWVDIVLWLVIMFLLFSKATKSPDYVHADALIELSGTKSVGTTYQRVLDEKAKENTPLRQNFPLKVGLITAAVLPLVPVIFLGVVGNLVMEMEINIAFLAIMWGVFCFICFVAGYAIANSGQKGLASWEESLGTFAEKVGGTVVKEKLYGKEFSDAVTFTYRGAEGRFDSEQRGEMEYAKTFTFIRFDLPNPIPNFHVFPYSGGVQRGKQDIELGWEVFDDLYVVHLGRENVAAETMFRQVFDRPMQETVLKLKQWFQQERISNHIELQVEKIESRFVLTIYFEGGLGTSDDMFRFYEHCTILYNGMAR
jgi:hypothetical protein